MKSKLALTTSCLLLLAGFVALQAATPGSLPPASDKQNVTFAKDIKPLFERSCFGCHGPKNAKAKLRLDSVEAIVKGSEDGKVIVVGDSAKSVLVRCVAGIGKKAMPPKPKDKDKGNYKPIPLTPEEIGLVRAWIDQSAK